MARLLKGLLDGYRAASKAKPLSVAFATCYVKGAASDGIAQKAVEKKEEEATATACREHPLHTDPYGSVQHCHTGSPQVSPSTLMSAPLTFPDHMAGRRHNLAQKAIVLTTCWLRSCQPSIRDCCETSRSAEILSLVQGMCGA